MTCGRRSVCSTSGNAEGLRYATGEDDLTIAPPMRVVKRCVNRCGDLMPSPLTWAVDKCRMRLADGAVKAASRAQRGRSEKRSALTARTPTSQSDSTAHGPTGRSDRHLQRVFWTASRSRKASHQDTVLFAFRQCDRIVWPVNDEPGACSGSVT